jgi:hypothetical protein
MHALHPSLPTPRFCRTRLLPLLLVVRDAVGAACGRTTLDAVQVPDGIAEVHPRTRRLVRQARVSAW